MFISERIVPSGVRLSRSRTLVVRPAVVCAVLWLASVVCSAHEIGTTRVAIWIEADRYRAEIVTDAQALSEKLAAASGQQRGETLDADQLQQRLAGFKDLLLSRVTLQFDGARVQPAVEYSVTSSSSQTAPSVRIQLTGAIPVDAAAFDWTYGWTYASYALTIHRGDAPPTTEWLEGGQPSAAVALAVPAPAASRSHTAGRYLLLGFTHIIPLGLDHILFVLGIFLLTRRLRPMLLQVTAFTVAHSITLGLGIFGLHRLRRGVLDVRAPGALTRGIHASAGLRLVSRARLLPEPSALRRPHPAVEGRRPRVRPAVRAWIETAMRRPGRHRACRST